MPKKRSKFQTRIEYIALRTFLGALGLFPYRIALSIGKMMGGAIPVIAPKFGRVARRNLEIAMPENSEEQNLKIVRGTFASIGRHIGFISKMKKLNLEEVRERVKVSGKQVVLDSYETNRGVIFITGHFGSWEVFNYFPAAHDLHINILVRRIDNHLIEKYIDAIRTRFGTVTLGKRSAPRKMYKLLQEGKIIGILADLNAQRHDGVFVDFFGVPAATAKSIAKLALKTNAIILPAFAVWNDDEERYHVTIEPAVEYEASDDHEKDVIDLTQKYTKVIEEYVRRYPEQWLWSHKRWNTRPEGEPGLY